MRKLLKPILCVAGLVMLGTIAYAALIGVQGQTRFPRIRYTGTVSYSNSTQNLQIAGAPTTVELVAGTFRTVTDPKSVAINVHLLNPQGTAYEGIGPNALYVEGTTDLNGDGVIGPGESGVMLTGDLLEMGSASDPNTHTSSVDFRFKVTGGYMAGAFIGQNAGAYADFASPTSTSWASAITNARIQPLKCGTAIGDFVWNDLNGNGIQDAGEPGIDGVTVRLLDENGNVKATTTTGIGPLNQHGYYEFSEAAFARRGQDTQVFIGFCAGTWQVQVDTSTLPAGFIPTPTNAAGSTSANDSNPNPATVVLPTDISKDYTLDFGYRSGAFGELGDFVWHDQNRNGIQDAGEPGIDGVTVNLRDSVTNAILGTTTTGPNGFYHFTGLLPGSYVVEVDESTLPAGGYTRTGVGQGTTATDSSNSPVLATLTLANMVDLTYDFGYVTPCTGSVGDFLWYDRNQNGIQDAGEPGLDGITVNLKDGATDAVVATTTSGPNGAYHFNGLCGDYKVEVDVSTLPAGMSPTQVGAAGSTIVDDSNPNPQPVSVADATTDNTIDFGFIAPCTGSIGDFVWHDANANGIQDAGEVGMAGVTVNLRRASDNAIIQTDISHADGSYIFEGLCPGDYLVEVVPPAGFTPSPTGQGGDTALDSNVNPTPVTLPYDDSSDLTVDFGFYGQPSIAIVKLTNGTDNDTAPGLYVPTGSPVTWTYVVTNTGNVTLTNVTVTDDQGVAVSCPQTTLAAGASMTCTASGIAVAGQYTNVGTATGSYGGSTVTASNPDNYFGSSPSIGILKLTNGTNNDSAPGIYVPVGSAVTWSYIVTNTGNVALHDVAVTDDKGVAVSCPKTTLAVGESMTCTATGTAIAGQYTNIGTVTGLSPTGSTVTASNPDNYFGTRPSISIIKKTNGTNNDSAPGIHVAVGSTVTWTYLITNTGNVALSNVTLTDDKIGTVTCPSTTLAVGASMTCTATGTAIAGQYANVGTVTGTSPQGTTVTASNPDHYYGDSGTIVIIKSAKPASGTFSFTTTTSGSPFTGFSLTGSTSAGGNVITRTGLKAGTYTVKELSQAGWLLTGIGGSTDINTPYACVVTGSNGSSGTGSLDTQTVTISLKIGDTVTCTFENTANGVTRTIGYWQTHTKIANVAWFGGTLQGKSYPGVASLMGDRTVCKAVDTLGRLMGGFWSSIPKTTTGASRTDIEQARMQLLQQLLGAELNYAAFGTLPSGGVSTLKSWEAALCGTNIDAIQTAMGQAGAFNQSGDSLSFTPGTAADPQYAKSIADYVYWDVVKK